MALGLVAWMGLWTACAASRTHTKAALSPEEDDHRRACKNEALQLSQDASHRLQSYVQGCGVLPGDAVALKIDDPAVLCAQHCQELPALLEESSVHSLLRFKMKCPKEAASLEVLINAIEFLDRHFYACADATTTTTPAAAAGASIGCGGGGDVPDSELLPLWGLHDSVPEEADRDAVKILFSGRNVWERFLMQWSAIPMTMANDGSFKMIGPASGIHDALVLRPQLPVSCHSDLVGWPVWLVVRSPRRDVEDAYESAFDIHGDYASLAGVAEVASGMPEKFAGEETLLRAVRSAARPAFIEAAVSYLAHTADPEAGRGWLDWGLDKVWSLLRSQKTVMTLTVEDPKVKHYRGTAFKFQCSEAEVEGSESKAFMTWVDGDVRSVAKTDHLAFIMNTLA